MNKKNLIIAATVILVSVGGYYFLSSQGIIKQIGQDRNMEGMNNGRSVAQSHRGYSIEVSSQPDTIEPKKSITFRYKIKNDKDEIVKNFQIAHEKIMHFIAVRNDLQYFQHLHPTYNESTGEFSVKVVFPEAGPYRLFPDFTPGDENPQNLPVTVSHDINVGKSSNYFAQSVVPDSEISKTYGVYNISFDFPKDLQKEKEITFGVSIDQNGKPVTNLENYLGALGHSVILKEGTLDFIHTHALDTKSTGAIQEHGQQQAQHGSTSEGADKGPKISFSTTFPKPGIYKIFTQLQHAGKVQIVDYIVKVN